MSDLVKREADHVGDVSALAPEDQKRAMAIAAQIDVNDSQALIQYGVGAQSKISGFADSMLTQLRAKDSGYVGDVLTSLVLKIKEVDAGSLTGKGGFLGGLLGNLAGAFKRFIARYEKLSVQIEKIIDELDAARMTLLKDITLLDGLYAKNLDYLRELSVYIAAGQMKLSELREKTLPELQAKAEASKDPMDAQRMQDFNQFLDRFDKKLYDLKLTRMVSIQTAPQVRLIQNSDQLLVEKIQSSILNTIPLWKNQIVIAISLFRQKKALDLQKEVTKTTNELLSKNSEMLKQGTVEVARESERGIVEIETLQKVNTDLISTIEETLRIQEEGRTKRQQAEGELARMEGELKARLTTIKGS
jgi:uncharacterized protein YaaN involved in tellurite resistance